jgi:hypothetical protein
MVSVSPIEQAEVVVLDEPESTQQAVTLIVTTMAATLIASNMAGRISFEWRGSLFLLQILFGVSFCGCSREQTPQTRAILAIKPEVTRAAWLL